MNAQVPFATLKTMLQAIITGVVTEAGSPPVQCSVHLADAPFAPTQVSQIADFTESSFTGYGAITLTSAGWTTPALEGTDLVSRWKTVATFAPSMVLTDPASIGGYYVVAGDGTTLVVAQAFDEPIQLVNTLTAIELVPEIRQSQSVYSIGPL